MDTIFRHGAPNQYDHAPQGTQCRVQLNDKEYELYIQRSNDEDKPLWEYIGVFSLNFR